MSYRRVDDAFWGGELALEISGNTDAIAAAFYLLTGPEAARSSIGVFRLSVNGLAEALGIPSRRASEALGTLSERGFCVVDDQYRMVFVVEAGRHEYGETPNPRDNRVKALVKALPALLSACPKSFIWNNFRDRYVDGWGSILEGLPKGLPRASGRVADASETGSTWSPTLEARSEKLEASAETKEEDVDQSLTTESTPPSRKKTTKTKKGPDRAEISWRVAAVWEHHLERRKLTYGRKGLRHTGPPPALTDDIKADIRRAMQVHDAELMGANQREKWQRWSKARAAGGGLFMKDFNLGIREGNNGEEGARGTTYLESWRCWKIQRGKADPVDGLAQVYFEKRERAEAKGAR